MSQRIAIAPRFHLSGRIAERLQWREGDAWRKLTEPEQVEWTRTPATVRERSGCVCLFALPSRLREAFWSVVQRPDEFDFFAAEVADLLEFKELPLSTGAICELVVARAGQPAGLAAGVLWGVVNLGEDEMAIVFDRLSLALRSGEGCRVPRGIAFDVVPPPRDTPDLLLVIREPTPASGPA